MTTPEPTRLGYAPPVRKPRTWFYVGAILLIPFSCLAIMAAYFVLNRLTGFSITD
jgi:hypothetical protein